ncbi:Hypothetical predicted protein, partial [Paramuricea clavata]
SFMESSQSVTADLSFPSRLGTRCNCCTVNGCNYLKTIRRISTFRANALRLECKWERPTWPPSIQMGARTRSVGIIKSGNMPLNDDFH